MRAYLHHDAADLSTSNRGDHKWNIRVWLMSLQVLTWSVQKKPLGIAFWNLCSCSSLSCPYFSIQCLNFLFRVWYVLRLLSQLRTVKHSRLLGFDPITMAIFSTCGQDLSKEHFRFDMVHVSRQFGENQRWLCSIVFSSLTPIHLLMKHPLQLTCLISLLAVFLTDLYCNSTKLNTA